MYSVRFWCYALLVAAWALDLVTPQRFVAAIFLNVPIALSSVTLDARLTRRLIVLALCASTLAAYVNASVEHHWDAIAVADRIVAGFSFLLVGVLSITSQRFARRAGELSERAEREARERRVRQAVERVRESIGVDLIERSLVREACSSLGTETAWYYTLSQGLAPSVVYYCTRGHENELEVENARPTAPIASLVQRVFDEQRIIRVREEDTFGRLVLDTLGVSHAVAAPVAEHGVLFGVLLIANRSNAFETDVEEVLRYYVDQGAIALARGKLFEELARSNAELKERSEVIRDIVYALSHDLRTPLAAASMTMRQAIEGRYGELPDAYREVLERSLRSNEELGRLAETLLLVSRYESGEASRNRERIDMASIAREVVGELEALWRGKSIEAHVQGENIMVRADRGEMRRACVNLVANAVSWTPSGGSVIVRVFACEHQAWLVVEDTGFGVPAELRGRLFQRIAGVSRHGAGTGLGLYIVRRIAEEHGGNIAYEPRESGGSVFTLRLPLAGGL